MKRIVITGRNSYIGTHIEDWISNHRTEWAVSMLNVRDDSWRNYDFTNTDVVIHLAGIVHQPQLQNREVYEEINVELTYNIANRAKMQGVKQFVFFSSMAVYGIEKLLVPNIITEDTPMNPQSLYGQTKLTAENRILKLNDQFFTVTIVRPPNVYGKGCKGKYIDGFTSIVKRFPILPYAYNNCRQSLIYIDNLCELVTRIIDLRKEGIFMPQDDSAVSAVELMNGIAMGIGKKIYFSKLLGFAVRILSFLPIVKKAYGGVEYSRTLSTINGINYVVVPFDKAIKCTVE